MNTEGNKIKNRDAENLVTLAREYYAERFPNPQRLGCPPPGEVIKVVKQRQIPDQALRGHLFECSECFSEYRQSLAQRQQVGANKKTWSASLAWIRSERFSHGAWKFAAVSAVFVLAVFIIVLIRPNPASDVVKVAGVNSGSTEVPSQAQAGDSAPKDAQHGAGSAPNESASGMQESQDNGPAMAAVSGPLNTIARRREVFEVDLENFVVSRQWPRDSAGDSSEDQPYGDNDRTRGEPAPNSYGSPSRGKVISLPATQALIILRLPENGAPGRYKISLIDPFGKNLLSTSASSPDGSILRVPLNLRQISNKKLRLRLSRGAEAPAFYDVIINAR